MEFKKLSAGFVSYGTSKPKPQEYEKGCTNVNFDDDQFSIDYTQQLDQGHKPYNPYLERFIDILAVCHTIIVEEKDDVLYYNASSPDELALTNAARYFGIKFIDRDEDMNMVVLNKFTGKESKFELLNVIEFTSHRKRMSVVVRTPEGKIKIMTKGADSHIVPRLASG